MALFKFYACHTILDLGVNPEAELSVQFMELFRSFNSFLRAFI